MYKMIYPICLALVLFISPANADTPHILQLKQSPSIIKHFHLIDLGPTDLEPNALSKHQDKPSQGPSINNSSFVIGNRGKGGFIWEQFRSEYAPSINGARQTFHSINNLGDILVSIQRGNSVEWLIWPTKQGWNSHRRPIDTVELEGEKVYLTKINDSQLVAGEAKPLEHHMPLLWYPEIGLYRVGHFQGLNFLGQVKSLNNNGLLVGKEHKHLEHFPFAWDGEKVRSLFPFRNRFQPPSDGKIIFEDLVITDDGVVYGTFWINRDFMEKQHNEHQNMQAFAWDIAANKLEIFYWNGMRVSAVNKTHFIVGSTQGKATFIDNNKLAPKDLLAAIAIEEAKGWELLEATDINDLGQIVGFGRKDGKVHLFLADPIKE